MPVLMTKEFAGRELYFDMRPNGRGEEAEGFWAVAVFESKRQEIMRQAEAGGKSAQGWIELLVYAVKRWNGFVDLDGKEIPCTAENIRALCESDHLLMMSILNMILDAARAGKAIAEKN